MKLRLTVTKSSCPRPTPIQLPLLLYFGVDTPHKVYIIQRPEDSFTVPGDN